MTMGEVPNVTGSSKIGSQAEPRVEAEGTWAAWTQSGAGQLDARYSLIAASNSSGRKPIGPGALL